MSFRKYLSVSLVIVMFSGCMSNRSEQLTFESSEISAIKRVKVLSIVTQPEIQPQIAGTLKNYGILIDSVMNSLAVKNAEKIVSPYQDILNEYDIREVVRSSTNKYIKDLNFDVTEVITDLNGEDFDPLDHIGDLSDEKLLVLNTSYSFNPSFNYIEVKVTATLYIEDLGDTAKTDERFLIKSWFSRYQSKKRKLKYSSYTIQGFNDKIENLRDSYSERIEATSNKGRKLRLAKKRSEKIKKLRGRPYIKNSPPIHRDDWNEANLKHHISEGVELTMSSAFKLPNISLTKENFKNKSVKIPYHSITSDSPRYFIRRTMVNLLEQATSSEHAYYLTKNNNIFIVPNGEMLSHQEWQLEFD